jgi:hypothetical protein
MKLNNNVLLIGTAAIAAGAYMIYKKSKEAKKELSSELDAAKKAEADALAKAAAAKAAQVAAAKAAANSLENPNSYASKVAKVQLYLGVASDGKVGANTNKALVAKFPKYATITSSNVDAILADIETAKTAANQMAQNKVTTDAKQKLIDYAKNFAIAANKEGMIAETIREHNAPQHRWDTYSKRWIPTGEYKFFRKGTEAGKSLFMEIIPRGSDGYVLFQFGFNKENYYLIDPKYFIVRPFN